MRRLKNLEYLISSARDFNVSEKSRIEHVCNICKTRGINVPDAKHKEMYIKELNTCLDKDESPFDALFVILGYNCQNGNVKITKENGDTLISSKHLILSLPDFINNIDKCYITEERIVISFTSLLNLGIHYEDIPFN